MSRHANTDYAPVARPRGARIEDHVGAEWACEEKCDGVWALVEVGEDGRIEALRGREGVALRAALTWDFVRERRWRLAGAKVYTRRRGRPRREWREGVVVERLATGLPGGLYVAELEALTERAQRAMAERGHPLLWLRDVIAAAGEDVRRWPYASRRELLERLWRGAERARLALVESRRFLRGEDMRAYYDAVVGAGGEGVVAHRVDAAYGARGAEVKFKAEDTADLAVVETYLSPRGTPKATLAAAHPIPQPDGSVRLEAVQTVVVPRGLVGQVQVGQVVEVRHAGALDGGAYRHGRLQADGPRGARVLRVREDKTAPDPLERVERVATAEVAMRCGVTEGTVRAWEHEGRLPLPVAHGTRDGIAVDHARAAGVGRRRGEPRRRRQVVVEGCLVVAYAAPPAGIEVVEAVAALPARVGLLDVTLPDVLPGESSARSRS